ncbi:MAG TPA: class I SAM-dependent methyltransferase [Longimicrobiales bacterium]|nr:class I SAM-dependent methyltransferase [Longimicrobiales bacterium]
MDYDAGGLAATPPPNHIARTMFKDHFSAHAAAYAKARPSYPAALLDFLAGLPERRDRAWDCGTGNGQAAIALAERFGHVVATDASKEQLRNAFRHPRVTYALTTAEAAALAAGAFDLVTAAQALHWFQPERFFAEARRALRRGGVVAVWVYGRPSIGDGVDAVLGRFHDVVAPFWPPERAIVEAGYRSVEFPFDEIEAPPLMLEQEWDADAFVAYLGTWSATRRYLQARRQDPVAPFLAELLDRWGAGRRRTVRWPLHLRVGRP